jgi:hypothetical protein
MQILKPLKIRIETDDAVKSISSINNEIKNTSEQTKSAKAELRELKAALLDLEPGTAEFQKMAARAAELEDAIGDVNAQVKALSSDTFALDAASGVISGMAGAYGAVQGAAALLGVENEDLMKVMVKLQAVQSVTNGINQVANMLNKDSAAGIALRNAGTKILNLLTVQQTAATGTATVATRALGVAMNALPILAIIGGVTALIAAFSSMGDEVEEVEEQVVKLNNSKLDRLQSEIDNFKRGVGTLSDVFDELDRKVAAGELSQAEAIKQRRAIIEDELNKLPQQTFQKLQAIKELEAAEANLAKFTGNLTQEQFKEFQKAYEDRKRILAEFGYDVKEFNRMNDDDQKALVKGILEREQGVFDQRNKLTKALSDIDKGLTDERKKNQQNAIDNERKRLELIFMLANQEKINELERLKRQEQRLIEEEASEEEILAKKQEVNDKEVQIATAKYEFLIKEAKGNAQKIKLLEAQKIGELEKLESDYQINITKFNEDRLKTELERISKSKKASTDAALFEIQNELEKEIQIATNAANEQLKSTNLTQKEREKIIKEAQQKELAIRKSFDSQIKDLQIQQVETERDILLKNTKLTEEERRAIIADSELKITKIREEALDTSSEIAKTKLQEFLDENTQYIEAVMSTVAQVVDLLGQIFEQQEEKALEASTQRFEAAAEKYDELLANRLISQDQYDAAIKRAEDRKAQEEKQARLKSFKQQKALNIVNAVMSTAQAVMQALGGMPPPISYVLAAINAALGAVQIGIISSQQFTAARGGIVPGSGPSTIDSVDAKLAPGETVINAQSSSMFPQLLSEINQMGGGVSLAPEPMENMTSSGGGTVFEPQGGPIRAYVVEQDMTDSQKRVRRMENAGTFG